MSELARLPLYYERVHHSRLISERRREAFGENSPQFVEALDFYGLSAMLLNPIDGYQILDVLMKYQLTKCKNPNRDWQGIDIYEALRRIYYCAAGD